MRYVSTRGGMAPKSFSEILIGGLAPDGGLIVPETYPQVSRRELTEWWQMNYRELACAIIGRYVTDIPAQDLREIVHKTYTAEIFRHDDITPIKPLFEDVYLLGLSNGPTLAFKDMALQLLGNLSGFVQSRNVPLGGVGAWLCSAETSYIEALNSHADWVIRPRVVMSLGPFL